MKQSYLFVILTIIFLALTAEKCTPRKTAHPLTSVSKEKTIEYNNPIEFDYTKDYEAQWKIVDSLNNKGLYKSALKQVDGIFEMAKTDQNHPQIIKAQVYKMNYSQYLEENDYVKSLYELDSLARNSEFPLKQLAHNLSSKLYAGYFSANYYSILDRTYTDEFDNQDVTTWSLRKIAETITYHKKASLEEADKLILVKAEDFKDLVNHNQFTKDSVFFKYKPTLFDLLARDAFNYFKSAQFYLPKPEDRFKLTDVGLLKDNEAFAKLNLKSTDTLNNDFYAIKVLQDLTKQHLKDKDPSALIDITEERLNFLKQNGNIVNFDQYYLKALDNLYQQYQKYPGSTRFLYLKALWYEENSSKEENKNSLFLKTAKEICEKAIKQAPNSVGADRCKSILSRIKAKHLTIKLEAVQCANSYHKMLVNFKNLQKVNFKLLKYDNEYNFSRNYQNDKSNINELLENGKAVKDFSENLPDPLDYAHHSIETEIPPLETGYYCLISYANDKLLGDKAIVNYNFFTVSNLSLKTTRLLSSSYEFTVLDRVTGIPYAGVDIHLYKYVYAKKERKNVRVKHDIISTNSEGEATYKRTNSITLYPVLTYKNDYLNPGQSVSFSKPYENNYKYQSTKTYYFLDRKIYRPGQTVYYKGITVKQEEDETELMIKGKNTVQFRDRNYQNIGLQEVTYNEFGSFSGSFKIPEAGLNGSMTISDKYGSVSFSVEEYKRPKFKVNFNPIVGTYKLGEEITIQGTANAYAGNNIDGAIVKYNVVREVQFPWWCYWRFGYMPNRSSFEVKSGTTITNEIGEFTIDFTAVSDESIKEKFSPTYQYYISADITDINGETRSGNTQVNVAKRAINLELNLPDKIDVRDLKHITASSRNLNGEPVNLKSTVTVDLLSPPKETKVADLWADPDINIYDKETHNQLFPTRYFQNEGAMTSWKVEKTIFSQKLDSTNNDTIHIERLNQLKTGYYKVTITANDKFGEKVEDVHHLLITDKKSSKPIPNSPLEASAVKYQVEPGNRGVFVISSDADTYIQYIITKDDKFYRTGQLNLNHKQDFIYLQINEEDRGSTFRLQCETVFYERSFQKSASIYVPLKPEDLKLSLTTYRDKMLPGSEEEWQLKITGPEGEKVAAELVATMYDASLDEFSSNTFSSKLKQHYYQYSSYDISTWFSSFNQSQSGSLGKDINKYHSVSSIVYPNLTLFGLNTYYYRRTANTYGWDLEDSYSGSVPGVTESYNEVVMEEAEKEVDAVAYKADKSVLQLEGKAESPIVSGEVAGNNAQSLSKTTSTNLSSVKARTNFNETAFFYPHLKTNEDGEIIFSFTMPEALTEWKFLAFGHDEEANSTSISQNVITQKDLMVVPNVPRFFREGDTIILSTKISNVSKENLEGAVQLNLFDPLNNKNIDVLCENNTPQQSFTTKAERSTSVSWKIIIPKDLKALRYKFVAKAGNFSDGEEDSKPVLTNRMLVTESIPLYLNTKGSKTFKLEKLLDSRESSTLTHHNVSLEYTSNPAWYAVKSLPYLMEYPYECAEQTFSRYYANSLAAHVVNKNEKIKEVFDHWLAYEPDAFLSNLEKNQELKNVILTETPWVLNAKSEEISNRQVALLFQLHKMEKQLKSTIKKLQKMQLKNGAWGWFTGMKANRYITQHIVLGFGHLKSLGVDVHKELYVKKMVEKAIAYLDDQLYKDYQYLKEHNADEMNNRKMVSYYQISYLYARSFHDLPVPSYLEEAYSYYYNQTKEYWHDDNLRMEAMIALLLERTEPNGTVQDDIMKSLKELALVDEEMGMYYKSNYSGYYWYTYPVETHSVIIEAFDKVAKDAESVNLLKVWLLKQRQTTHWKTTTATAYACYSLLSTGGDWLTKEDQAAITLGDMKVEPDRIEKGSGYFKKSYTREEIKPSMGKITITKKEDGVSWGGFYWQYFEDLDKITPHETPLSIKKDLFTVSRDQNGEIMKPIDKTGIQVGDLVRIRVEIHTDRDLEYVHLKDMRASGFEPVNVISTYKWRDGFGYYESTKDASSNFFIGFLRKGSYVFEYDVKAFQAGNFSNGITTIQCMYAPEFTSHSKGIRLEIEAQ